MSKTDKGEPQLSAIVMASGADDEALGTLIRSWSRQTLRGRIEIVFVCPRRQDLTLAESDLAVFAGWQIVETGELGSTSVARTAGIHAARAPVVALTEDHCFPNPEWAEAIVARHRDGWGGVGPLFVNANPDSATSWANFLIEYGCWADPDRCGEWSHIPGHNSTYKRDALLEYGEKLPEYLEAESAMQWDMQKRGHKFYLESKARSHHFNFSRFGPSVRLRFHVGRLFSANRAREWPLPRRLFYTLCSPLIPAVRFVRALAVVGSAGSSRLPLLLPALLILLVVDGLGEMTGYATGAGDSMQKLSGFGELERARFLIAPDRALFAGFADSAETGGVP